jgi:hypothetical protein
LNKLLVEQVGTIVVPEETLLDGICFPDYEPLPVLMSPDKMNPEAVASNPVSLPEPERILARFFRGLRVLAGAFRRFNSARIDEERLTSRDPYLEVYRINRIY